MKIINNIGVIFLCLVNFCFFSCNRSATDGYGEMTFLEEGNMSNLRTYIGYQQIILAWDNPTDENFVRNQVIYRTDDGLFGTIVTEKLVDSIVVDHLYSNSDYNFEIYTMTAGEDYSEPLKVRLKPENSLDIPMCELKFISQEGEVKAHHEIHFSGLSDSKMLFAGEITYTLKTDSYNQGYKRQTVFEINEQNHISEIRRYEVLKIGLAELKLDENYVVTYTINVWPTYIGKEMFYSRDIVRLSGNIIGTVKHE